MDNRSGYFVVDIERLDAEAKQITNTELVKKTKMSKNTILRIQKGEDVQKASAVKYLRGMGITDFGKYLIRASEKSDRKIKRIRDPRRMFQSWQLIGEPLEMRSPNGLFSYRVGKAEHIHDSRIARTKCYDFEAFSEEEIQYIHRVLLARHREVCMRLKKDSCFPEYIDSGFVGEKVFWVVETWEEGQYLDKFVSEGMLEVGETPMIAKSLAEGLLALHQNGIVRRELTPKFLSIRESDRSLLFLDFELARITCGVQSRPMDWPRNPFLAPEVDSPNVDFRADLFSWAQIVVFCLTQKRPSEFTETEILKRLKIPKPVFSLLDSCLQRNLRWRPAGFEKVLEVVENWG